MVDFSCSDFVTETLRFQPPTPQQKGPISDPKLHYENSAGPSVSTVCEAALEIHNSEQIWNLAPLAAVAFSILEYGRL